MHEMIDMHSKYDNMHKNEMFYGLIYISSYIITCINFMLLRLNLRIGLNRSLVN